MDNLCSESGLVLVEPHQVVTLVTKLFGGCVRPPGPIESAGTVSPKDRKERGVGRAFRPADQPMEQWLKKAEVAAVLRVTTRTVEWMVQRGKFPVVSVTGTRAGRRIPLSAVVSFQRRLLAGGMP